MQLQHQQEQYKLELESLKEEIDNKIAKQMDLEDKLANSITQNMYLTEQI